jgi:hypothetical protein
MHGTVVLCTLTLLVSSAFCLDGPLFLSKYLHNPALAQTLSRVPSLPYGAASWSGYITVGQTPFRNTFFW